MGAQHNSGAATPKAALFTNGFRPFFLGAVLWAGVSMVLWILVLTGNATVPSAFDPISWHAHAMLFGYLGAVLPGFLLTAVPNWTARPALSGAPLAGLAMLWLAGRIATTVSAGLPPLPVAIVDLSGLALVALYLLREIVVSKNWRNLVVLTLISCLIGANGLFHWEAAHGAYAAGGTGFRLGLAVAIMLIVIIGGRVIPAFTRNWLVREDLPTRPATRPLLDKVTLALMALALAAWVYKPEWAGAGILLLAAASMLMAQLIGWRGYAARSEPLVWILHVGFGFAALGALALSLSILTPTFSDQISAQHLLMSGGVGIMTVAVMTRATLGHSGQSLTAGVGTLAIYVGVIGAVIARFSVGLAPDYATALLYVAGLLWCFGFFGMAVIYGPLLVLRPMAAQT